MTLRRILIWAILPVLIYGCSPKTTSTDLIQFDVDAAVNIPVVQIMTHK
jgi:hypothetical protein